MVDNNSSDGSVDYLRARFAQVQFIGNKENTGFAKANNLGLLQATGKYILFLNPDTIVAEDSFEKCITFMQTNSPVGAAGVKMIDGGGVFLKESKRGFPSPWVSFCKASGLTALFPHSKLFAAYYLGHLKENEPNQVDVLSGAFMMLKKETLNKTGGFDEQFFMYAEDIDLSYRIQQAGYLNYYLPDITIIHFKGESTRKDFRYVKLFYKAMSQFVRKHFSGGVSFVFRALMEWAIWLRAGLSFAGHFFSPAKKKIKKEEVRTFLIGDTASKNDLKTKLPGQRILTGKETEANETIFCEGEAFSFHRIIDMFMEHNARGHYKIHAHNSDSIAGSNSKDDRGETIPL